MYLPEKYSSSTVLGIGRYFKICRVPFVGPFFSKPILVLDVRVDKIFSYLVLYIATCIPYRIGFNKL